MIVEFVRELRVELDSEIERITKAVVNGSAANWEDYKRMIGITTGLKKAREMVDSVYNQYLNNEE